MICRRSVMGLREAAAASGSDGDGEVTHLRVVMMQHCQAFSNHAIHRQHLLHQQVQHAYVDTDCITVRRNLFCELSLCASSTHGLTTTAALPSPSALCRQDSSLPSTTALATPWLQIQLQIWPWLWLRLKLSPSGRVGWGSGVPPSGVHATSLSASFWQFSQWKTVVFLIFGALLAMASFQCQTNWHHVDRTTIHRGQARVGNLQFRTGHETAGGSSLAQGRWSSVNRLINGSWQSLPTQKRHWWKFKVANTMQMLVVKALCRGFIIFFCFALCLVRDRGWQICGNEFMSDPVSAFGYCSWPFPIQNGNFSMHQNLSWWYWLFLLFFITLNFAEAIVEWIESSWYSVLGYIEGWTLFLYVVFLRHHRLHLGFSAMACLAEWQQCNASYMQCPESAIDSLVPRMHRILKPIASGCG